MEEKSLREEMLEMKESLEIIAEGKKKKKERGFRIPFKARVNPRQAKNNYITVMMINENGAVDFQRKQIIEQTVDVDGCPRLATGEYVLHYKKNPVLICPSWNTKPFSPADNYEDSVKEKTNTNGYRLLLNIMKNSEIKGKKSIGWGVGIGVLIIAGIIVYALITGGA